MALSLLASWTPVPKLSPGKSFSSGEDILSVLTTETVKEAGKWIRVGAVGMDILVCSSRGVKWRFY